MKAVICTKYGPPEVLEIRDIEIPILKDNEILIRVHASTVSVGDTELRGLKFSFKMKILIRLGFGIRGPRNKVLGQDMAGVVENVGDHVKLFKKGDQIFGSTGFRLGGNAEYKNISEKSVICIKPNNMNFEEATSIPFGGLDSLHFLRKSKINSGDKILINGAGGSIGTMAVQLAKHFGADVTAVDSKEKLDMLSSIGADYVIDYTKEDFTKSGKTYDIILDVIGKSSYSHSLNCLNPKGRYVLANPSFSQFFRKIWTSLTSNKKVVISAADPKPNDLIFLKDLIEDGKIQSVIDKKYPLDQAIEAHKFVDTGKKLGNVVLISNLI